jgi:hypothetical protein
LNSNKELFMMILLTRVSLMKLKKITFLSNHENKSNNNNKIGVRKKDIYHWVRSWELKGVWCYEW